LSVATHSITAVYGGDSNFNGSTSNTVSQVVNKANTTTSITSSQNPSGVGQTVIFTATVSAVAPGTGTPSGTVSFRDSGTEIGTGPLSAGVATFSTSSLTAGSHIITAVYLGDGSFNGSTSGNLTQQVNKGNTTTTVSSSANPSVSGQSVTFTATVKTSSNGPVTVGTVTFKDGANTLATLVSLNASGQATFTISTLSV